MHPNVSRTNHGRDVYLFYFSWTQTTIQVHTKRKWWSVSLQSFAGVKQTMEYVVIQDSNYVSFKASSLTNFVIIFPCFFLFSYEYKLEWTCLFFCFFACLNINIIFSINLMLKKRFQAIKVLSAAAVWKLSVVFFCLSYSRSLSLFLSRAH